MFYGKKSLRALLVTAFVVVCSTSTYASSIFGSEGNDRCGLGTMLWGNAGDTICTQSSEASTNNFAMNESFSMTSGTSGCSSSGLVQATQEQMHYANTNFEELKFEMAQGNGEVLSGFASTMGCSSHGIELFNSMSKSQYENILPTNAVTPNQMLQNVINKVSADPVLSAHCHS